MEMHEIYMIWDNVLPKLTTIDLNIQCNIRLGFFLTTLKGLDSIRRMYNQISLHRPLQKEGACGFKESRLM